MKPLANFFAFRALDPEIEHLIEARLGRWISVHAPAQQIVSKCDDWKVFAVPIASTELTSISVQPDPSSLIVISQGYDELASCRARVGTPGSWDDVIDLSITTPGRLSNIPGDFTYFATHRSLGSVGVRSASGLAPLYLYQDSNLTCLSTLASYLVSFLGSRAQIDPLVWAAFSSGCTVLPDNRSFIKGARTIQPGEAVVIRSGRPARFVSYFDPVPTDWKLPNEAKRKDHQVVLRECLLANLSSGLSQKNSNLLALSGGVDSSSLGALAVNELGLEVASVSLLPPRGAPGEAKERGYVEHLGERVPFTTQLTYGLDLPRLIDLVQQVPDVGFPVPHSVFCGLPMFIEDLKAKGNIIETVFSGEHADEICGSYVTLPDWAISTGFRELVRSIPRLPTGPKDFVRWVAWRYMWKVGHPRIYMPKELLAMFSEDLRQEYREWRSRHIANADTSGPWPFLRLWRTQAGWVSMGWEVCSALGLRRVLPFLSRELVELVYQCHPCELVGPGTKKILRGALDGLVPDKNLYRPDKGSNIIPEYGSIRWGKPFGQLIQEVLTEDWREVREEVGYPEIFPLAILHRAGNSWDSLAR